MSSPRPPGWSRRRAAAGRSVRSTWRLTKKETGEFFRLSGQALPDADVAHLAEHTEGWPAGLRLAAMFLSRNPGPGAAADFAGDDQALTDYLLGEVIASQPPRMRSFLLATSVPDQICAELADVLLDEDGGGQRDLEQLEQSNTFITALGAHRRWYRYHPLLREALQHLLLLEDPVLLRSLHRRAATWFAAHGAPVPALRHAAAAQDWTLLGELFVTRVGPLVASADRRRAGVDSRRGTGRYRRVAGVRGGAAGIP